jgi:transposase-like protein
METPVITTELIKDYRKHDTRGRRITEPSRKAEIISGYAASGLTQKAYARSEGVNYHTLVSWLGQSRRTSVSGSRPMAKQQTEAKAPGFAQITWPPALPSAPATSTAARLEVVLPDGVIVRGDDPSALVVLLRALAALASGRPC